RTASPRWTIRSLAASCPSWRYRLRYTKTWRNSCGSLARPRRSFKTPSGRSWARLKASKTTSGRSAMNEYMSRSTKTRYLPTESHLSRRRFLQWTGASLAGTFAHGYAAGAPQVSSKISGTDLGGLTLFQGAGCNVIAMRGEEGALMIDGGLAANADA